MRLEDELKAAKCRMAPEAFEDLIRATFASNYPEQTTEWLARHPSKGLEFCGFIRGRVKAASLPEEVIMGTLENLRKRSKLRLSAS